MTGSIVRHILGQHPADPHGDGPVDLAAALHWVDQPANVRSVDAPQDPDFAGYQVNGNAECLHIESRSTRRKVRLPLGFEAMPLMLARGVKIGERNPPVA
jgi:hypothetical protein